MSDDDNESDQTAVRTYIPEHQEDIWKEDAEAMDMSLSEFVRSMVQAGRRGFNPADGGDDNTPADNGVWFREGVLDAIRNEPYISFEQLVQERLEVVEAELDDLLDALVKERVIRYLGRRGGYVLVDDE